MDDNFLLTQRLVDIPHRKFVFVSTLAVYPPTGRAVRHQSGVILVGIPPTRTATEAALIVREGLADVLAWLGQPVRPLWLSVAVAHYHLDQPTSA